MVSLVRGWDTLVSNGTQVWSTKRLTTNQYYSGHDDDCIGISNPTKTKIRGIKVSCAPRLRVFEGMECSSLPP